MDFMVRRGVRRGVSQGRVLFHLILCGGLSFSLDREATAACSTIGASIVCNSAATVLSPNTINSATSGLTVTVNSGASVSALLGIGYAVNLTGTNYAFTNNGTIDPSLLGLIAAAATGVKMGNATGGSVALNNGGSIYGSGLLATVSLLGLGGTAIDLQSGAGGVITLNNSGLITAGTAFLGAGVLAADSTAIAAYGGGRVNMVNTGTVTGRVGFATASGGNSFINAGTINGSVHLGANSTNTFTAVTGSQVNSSGGVAVDVLGLLGLNLSYAAAGQVNGGENGNDTLILQNAVSGTGSGLAGTGTASASVYRNFENLVVNSGSWTLNGALVSGATSLNGGLVTFDSASNFGSGTLTSAGGTVQAASAGLTLPNPVSLGTGGLSTTGSNSFALSGAISGSGALSKGGSHVLTLSGNNTFSGGTSVSAGGLMLGSGNALGSGALTVNGAATVDTLSALNVGNAIVLNSALTTLGSNDLGLNGAVSGSGNLVKSGSGVLTLGATGNTYSGGTTLNAGTLRVGGSGALGSGALTVTGASSLSSTAAAALSNAVVLNGNLGIAGSNDLSLSGVVSGSGQLSKSGSGGLSLSGANSYSGGTVLGGGTLSVGNAGALGSGQLNVSGAATLSGNGVTLGNGVALNAALTASGDLGLSGVLAGSGSLIKSGSGSLALNGANTYSGGTVLQSGSLVLGNSTALGSGAVQVSGAATLDAGQAVAVTNAVQLGAALTLGGSQDVALGGMVSGSGSLIKNGNAGLTLQGANTYSGGTTLNAGRLSLGNAAALGSGALSVGGTAALGLGGNYALSNAVQLGGALTVDTAGNTASLSGAISGSGSLLKSGSGTLTLSGANSYAGGTTLAGGGLMLDSATALGSGGLAVSANTSLDSTAALLLTTPVQLAADLTLAGSQNLTLAGAITGSGALIKNGSATVALTGGNSFGSATINSGTLQANGASLAASVSNNGHLVLAQNLAGTYSGSIGGSGTVEKSGPGALVLSGSNTFAGGLAITSGSLETRGGQALADSLAVSLAGGAQLLVGDSEALGSIAGTGAVSVGAGANLALGGNGSNSNFDGVLQGAGGIIKNGAGTLSLSGVSTHSGGVAVNGGALRVDGSLASANVNIGNGATLAGSGTLSGAVSLADGARLSAGNGQTLTLGALTLSQGSTLDFSLGAAQAIPQPVLRVDGNLTLDGTLNITDLGGFGIGVYRLFAYGGSLTDLGLDLGALPASTLSSAMQVQTSVLGQVNLIVQDANANLQFWNGVKAAADGVITGGNGTWASGASNWTDFTGLATQLWNNQFAVFGGVSGGNVDVSGSQSITGMQFLANGYILGGSGQLQTSGSTTLRVEPLTTATINTAMGGSGSLNKRDAGTLILGGNNSYTGGTTLSEGVLQVDADNRLGDASGSLTFNGGTLRVTGNAYQGTGRAITLGANGGGFDIDSAANTFTVSQALGGSGAITKAGAGTLVLSGVNSYSGGTQLAAGTLVAGSGSALGSGALSVTANAALASSGPLALSNGVSLGSGVTLGLPLGSDLTLNGIVSGATGALAKTGSGTLTLAATNTYGGGTTLGGGTLVLGNDQALGSAGLSVTAASSLASTGARTVANDLALGADLTVSGAQDLTLNGTVSGGANLIKAGSGTLTLNGNNSYNETRLDSGSLVLGSSAAIGNGAIRVTGASRLDGATPLVLGNALDLGALLDVAASQNLTLNGNITGAGGLGKSGATTSLTLNGTNTFSGGMQLGGGSLLLGNDGALGGGVLTVNASSSLDGASALTLGNGVQLNADLTVAGTRDLVLNGTVAGTGQLVKGGGSTTLTLNGSNSYSGGTISQGGILALGNSAALGSGALTVSGATVLGGNSPLVLGNTLQLNANLGLSSGLDLSLNGSIGGSGSLLKAGAGTLVLNGPNSYAGGTDIAGGTLVLGSNTALGTGALRVNGLSTLGGSLPLLLNNDVVLAAGLNLDATHDIALQGGISGAGGLAISGGGSTTLGGANTYAGGTQLNGGRLVLGGAQALGTGVLTVDAAAALATTQSFALANALVLNNTLTLEGQHALSLDGGLSGSGALLKNGSATLTLNGTNTFSGGLGVNGGTLAIGNAAAAGSGDVTIGAPVVLDNGVGMTLANNFILNGGLTFAGARDLALSGTLSGTGRLVKNGGGVLALSGVNSYSGGVDLNGGTLIGDSGSLLGDIVTQAGTSLVFAQNANGSYGGPLSGAGNLSKTGAGELVLGGANSLGGTISVLAGTLAAQGGQAITGASQVQVDVGATLRLDGSETVSRLIGGGAVDITGGNTLTLGGGSDNLFAGGFHGSGNLNKVGGSLLMLTGNSTNTGGTQVSAGTLRVDGTLSSATLNVQSGATLSGNGTVIGAVTVDNGGRLQADALVGTLTVGDLLLSSTSIVDFALGAPGAGSPIDVTGNLTLDGILNVTDSGGFGLGVYRLFSYAGSLTDNGVTLGALPPVSGTTTLQVAVPNEVNLLVENNAGDLQFWNGGTVSADGIIHGGNGTWDGALINWTSEDGLLSHSWGGVFAVFSGTAGVVTVDGTQAFEGMQFITNGYVLQGNPGAVLNAVGDANGDAIIRVDGGDEATINATIDGTATLVKHDGGTLILGAAANDYLGGTRVEGGVLQVSGDAQLGAASGNLTLNGGALRVTGGAYTQTDRNVILGANGGVFDIADVANDFLVSQPITGPGSLGKTGPGTLVLAAANTYGGGTRLLAGGITVGDDAALGSGGLQAAAGTELDASQAVVLDNALQVDGPLAIAASKDITLAGVVSGAGGLVKNGATTLTLNGGNSYGGGTTLNAGRIVVGTSTALGGGTLTAAAGTALDSSVGGLSLANNLLLNGDLTLDGSFDLALTGLITGTGGLVKNGTATLSLSGDNNYTGDTWLNAGGLVVGSNGALGDGDLHVAAGTTLDSAAAVSLDNDVLLNGDLAVLGSNNLTLSGQISGTGGILKSGNARLSLLGANTYGGDTWLNGGTLEVGNDDALGTGTLHAAAGTALDSSTPVTLANQVDIAGPFTVLGSKDLTLDGVVSGAGSLLKTGPAVLTLNGINTYLGGTTLAGGTLVIGNAQALGGGDLTVSAPSTLGNSAPFTLVNDVHLLSALTLQGLNDLTLSGDIDGSGNLVKNGAGTLALTGNNSYSGGTTVNAGTLAGDSDSLQGSIVTAAGSVVDFLQAANGSFNGNISGGGAVVKNGAGTLTLTGSNSYGGGTTVNAGTLAGNTDSLQGNIVNNATVVFNQTADGIYGGVMSGAGDLVKEGSGALTLSGNNTFTGDVFVNTGQLLVTGVVDGASITVAGGAFIGGSGTIGGPVTLAGGAHLVAGTYMTPLSFADALILSPATELDFALGTAGAPTTLVSVGGDLTLDGILNISDAGGLGSGIYRLFAYAGTLTDNLLSYGLLPPGYDASRFTLQTAFGGQVNLLVESVPGEIQFWNGNKTVADGAISGGNGVWSSTTNWTDASGNETQSWGGRFAAFAGTAGQVTVDGVQAITGMQFLSDGYWLLTGSGGGLNLTGAATPIRVDDGVTAEVDVALGGSGGINKTGGGTLVLERANGYSGGTTISGGRVQVAADDRLGAGGTGVTLDGGILSIAGTGFTGTNRSLTLGANGGGVEILDAANNFTLSQALGGSGGLTKLGAGTLTLTGSNSYSGGTTVAAGTLAGDSASLQGNISAASGTTLRFDQGSDGLFLGSITGAGAVVKTGAGNLTLGQANAYSGGTTVSAGTLTGNSSSLQGNIVNDATVVFNQSGDGIFAGNISGGGTLIKTGAGTLSLTGDHPLSGVVTVIDGSLLLSNGNVPDSVMNIASGGQLLGSGWVGSVTNGGTVLGAMGGGHVSVAGNYLNTAGGTLLVDLDEGAGNHLTVTGSANLQGRLRVLSGFAYQGASTTYTVLSAAGGVSGTFDEAVIPTLAFLDASLAYQPNSVELSLVRNDITFASVALTPNQRGVAAALDAMGAGTLYNSILSLDVAEAQRAYDLLSGEAFGSSSAALIGEVGLVMDALSARTRAGGGCVSQRREGEQASAPCVWTQMLGAMGTYAMNATDYGWPAALGQASSQLGTGFSGWGHVLGGWGRLDGHDGSAATERDTSGVLVGLEHTLSEQWRVGLMGGYSDTTAKVGRRASKAKVDSYHLAAYAGYLHERWALSFGAGYSLHKVDSRRTVAFGNFSDRLSADYDAHTAQIFGEVSRNFDAGVALVEPYARLTFVRYETETFHERGGAARLEGSSKQAQTELTLGGRLMRQINLEGDRALLLRAGLGWNHAFGDDTADTDMRFSEGGGAFSVKGAPLSRDRMVVEAGAEFRVSPGMRLGFDYLGQLGKDSRDQQLRVSVGYRF